MVNKVHRPSWSGQWELMFNATPMCRHCATCSMFIVLFDVTNTLVCAVVLILLWWGHGGSERWMNFLRAKRWATCRAGASTPQYSTVVPPVCLFQFFGVLPSGLNQVGWWLYYNSFGGHIINLHVGYKGDRPRCCWLMSQCAAECRHWVRGNPWGQENHQSPLENHSYFRPWTRCRDNNERDAHVSTRQLYQSHIFKEHPFLWWSQVSRK